MSFLSRQKMSFTHACSLLLHHYTSNENDVNGMIPFLVLGLFSCGVLSLLQ